MCEGKREKKKKEKLWYTASSFVVGRIKDNWNEMREGKQLRAGRGDGLVVAMRQTA